MHGPSVWDKEGLGLVNWKDLFWALMDLEKAYDTIDLNCMWQMLRVYVVE